MYELIIQNGNKIYQPVVKGPVKWETNRKNQPGKLTFSVFKDSVLNVQEGNAVRFKSNGHNIFYGFVFKKSHKKDKRLVDIIAYDQLRYLKNKDTLVYTNKRTDELISHLAKKFNLNVGMLANTEYKIASRVEDNQCLIDMIQNSIDETIQMKSKIYTLYDDFGKLTLKNVENMKVNLLIDDETAQDISYTSSIDGETYNKIKLSYSNEDTGKRDIYISQDSNHIKDWGVLQYYESIDSNVNGKAKADALLYLYNQKERSLSISKAFGDVRIRAGCIIPVNLDLVDMDIKNYMMIEKVTHTFSRDSHFMDLNVRGGVINA